eukprot:gene23612-biopygen11849
MRRRRRRGGRNKHGQRGEILQQDSSGLGIESCSMARGGIISGISHSPRSTVAKRYHPFCARKRLACLVGTSGIRVFFWLVFTFRNNRISSPVRKVPNLKLLVRRSPKTQESWGEQDVIYGFNLSWKSPLRSATIAEHSEIAPSRWENKHPCRGARDPRHTHICVWRGSLAPLHGCLFSQRDGAISLCSAMVADRSGLFQERLKPRGVCAHKKDGTALRQLIVDGVIYNICAGGVQACLSEPSKAGQRGSERSCFNSPHQAGAVAVAGRRIASPDPLSPSPVVDTEQRPAAVGAAIHQPRHLLVLPAHEILPVRVRHPGKRACGMFFFCSRHRDRMHAFTDPAGDCLTTLRRPGESPVWQKSRKQTTSRGRVPTDLAPLFVAGKTVGVGPRNRLIPRLKKYHFRHPGGLGTCSQWRKIQGHPTPRKSGKVRCRRHRTRQKWGDIRRRGRQSENENEENAALQALTATLVCLFRRRWPATVMAGRARSHPFGNLVTRGAGSRQGSHGQYPRIAPMHRKCTTGTLHTGQRVLPHHRCSRITAAPAPPLLPKAAKNTFLLKNQKKRGFKKAVGPETKKKEVAPMGASGPVRPVAPVAPIAPVRPIPLHAPHGGWGAPPPPAPRARPRGGGMAGRPGPARPGPA